jgi:hypothetical protein
MTPVDGWTATPYGLLKRAAVPMPFTLPASTPVAPPPAIVATVAFGKMTRTLLLAV